MYDALRQTYRHIVQQSIVQQEMRSLRQAPKQPMAWECGGIVVLVSAAATCGLLAQIHLG